MEDQDRVLTRAELAARDGVDSHESTRDITPYVEALLKPLSPNATPDSVAQTFINALGGFDQVLDVLQDSAFFASDDSRSAQSSSDDEDKDDDADGSAALAESVVEQSALHNREGGDLERKRQEENDREVFESTLATIAHRVLGTNVGYTLLTSPAHLQSVVNILFAGTDAVVQVLIDNLHRSVETRRQPLPRALVLGVLSAVRRRRSAIASKASALAVADAIITLTSATSSANSHPTLLLRAAWAVLLGDITTSSEVASILSSSSSSSSSLHALLQPLTADDVALLASVDAKALAETLHASSASSTSSSSSSSTLPQVDVLRFRILDLFVDLLHAASSSPSPTTSTSTTSSSPSSPNSTAAAAAAAAAAVQERVLSICRDDLRLHSTLISLTASASSVDVVLALSAIMLLVRMAQSSLGLAYLASTGVVSVLVNALMTQAHPDRKTAKELAVAAGRNNRTTLDVPDAKDDDGDGDDADDDESAVTRFWGVPRLFVQNALLAVAEIVEKATPVAATSLSQTSVTTTSSSTSTLSSGSAGGNGVDVAKLVGFSSANEAAALSSLLSGYCAMPSLALAALTATSALACNVEGLNALTLTSYPDENTSTISSSSSSTTSSTASSSASTSWSGCKVRESSPIYPLVCACFAYDDEERAASLHLMAKVVAARHYTVHAPPSPSSSSSSSSSVPLPLLPVRTACAIQKVLFSLLSLTSAPPIAVLSAMLTPTYFALSTSDESFAAANAPAFPSVSTSSSSNGGGGGGDAQNSIVATVDRAVAKALSTLVAVCYAVNSSCELLISTSGHSSCTSIEVIVLEYSPFCLVTLFHHLIFCLLSYPTLPFPPLLAERQVHPRGDPVLLPTLSRGRDTAAVGRAARTRL